ncbi:uncharacterized protein MELLADRAFT_101984 [Melampsora larici-populina 98AG31]|uniref:Secreted protein n=1 Tax=Melampsora larici-populina (strain 98AG31 / pathotype 3-4-7) TaxID=747676 RepID=F4R5L1_MELLP|nr:uncharacterized protein MELLADRAFT_101984 [Melampsora larici-populina 98AG31]EGG12064.1 hypothetical protein MELLADRAFT_101984 [Melampsora larici-populina 98AG31]
MKVASWIPLIIASIAFSIQGLPSAYKSSLLEVPDEAQDIMSWARTDPMLEPVERKGNVGGAVDAVEPTDSKQHLYPCRILSKRASKYPSSEAILRQCLENRAKSSMRVRIDAQKEAQRTKNYGKWFFLYRIGYDIKDDLALQWRRVVRWLRMHWRAWKRKISGMRRAENLPKQKMSAIILLGAVSRLIGIECGFRQKDILASMKYQDMKVSRFSSQGLTMIDKMGKED